MTLNDLERRNSPYFAFFPPNSIALQADYVTVVEDRPIMSAKYRFPVPVLHFRPKLNHPAARSLCDSWDTRRFGCQYRCNRLSEKTRPRNDLLRVDLDVKLCSLMLTVQDNVYHPPTCLTIDYDVQTQVPINHLRQGPFDTRWIGRALSLPIDCICAPFRKINYYLPGTRLRTAALRTAPDHRDENGKCLGRNWINCLLSVLTTLLITIA